ncbi:MAG TPA: hypothetical protein VN611_09755 [Patescibacteria group bacterium]|nr:hypothetical protein [Patescibacteria group bacterium]
MKPIELQILIFSSEGGKYGVDAEQIAGLADGDSGEAGVHFSQLMGVAEGNDYSRWAKRLWIKNIAGMAVLVPEPDEVAVCSTADIRCLPTVLKAAVRHGVWGFWIREEEIIILVDFHKNEQLRRLTGGEEIAGNRTDIAGGRKDEQQS